MCFALILFDAIALVLWLIVFLFRTCTLLLLFSTLFIYLTAVFHWECLSCHFMLSCTHSCFHVWWCFFLLWIYNQATVYGLKTKKYNWDIQPPQSYPTLKWLLIKHCYNEFTEYMEKIRPQTHNTTHQTTSTSHAILEHKAQKIQRMRNPQVVFLRPPRFGAFSAAFSACSSPPSSSAAAEAADLRFDLVAAGLLSALVDLEAFSVEAVAAAVDRPFLAGFFGSSSSFSSFSSDSGSSLAAGFLAASFLVLLALGFSTSGSSWAVVLDSARPRFVVLAGSFFSASSSWMFS